MFSYTTHPPPFRTLQAGLIPVMGNASAVIAAAGAFLCCWVYLPGEGARALAAVPSCALLLALQDDGGLFRGTGFNFSVPMGALSVAWAGSALYYILAKVRCLCSSVQYCVVATPPRPSVRLGVVGYGGISGR